MQWVDSPSLRFRVLERITAWRVAIDHMAETESSVLGFGRCGDQPVVVKVIKRDGDEWRSGEVLRAFGGGRVVRVIDFVEGALLLERLHPGDSLASTAVNGGDEEATRILAGVVGGMCASGSSITSVPTVEDWGCGFERYAARGCDQIPGNLVGDARCVYAELCASQSRPRLLHGDLHHENVLFDSARGWVAIDAKGVIGEPEYEVGAALRNPSSKPDLFLNPSIINARAGQFANHLGLDRGRILAWSFAQAILSAIWAIEDGHSIDGGNSAIALAGALRPML